MENWAGSAPHCQSPLELWEKEAQVSSVCEASQRRLEKQAIVSLKHGTILEGWEAENSAGRASQSPLEKWEKQAQVSSVCEVSQGQLEKRAMPKDQGLSLVVNEDMRA